MNQFKSIIKKIQYYRSFLRIDIAKIYLKMGKKRTKSNKRHLEAAIHWICRAQDVFNDGGVARSYSLIYSPYFKRKGWVPSYPETTGYIIPTMYDYAKFVISETIYNRATQMADWECTVQMENGAVQGGTIDQTPSPAIFNTGQVVFGWIRAYQETKNKAYLDSAIRAGNFLIKFQDTDGAWRKSLSNYASGQMPTYAYNTRTAWALCSLGSLVGEQHFIKAGVKNINYVLDRLQMENGWFNNNCLGDPTQPLLHTIAYCIRGILEVGILLNDCRYIKLATKSANALIDTQKNNGSLGGRFSKDWKPTVSWSCLTGNAQMSIIWGRLYQRTENARYFDCMKKINTYLKEVQVIHTSNRDIFGGIPGSDPLHGDYGAFEILNWATKFYIDALLLEESIGVNGKKDL